MGPTESERKLDEDLLHKLERMDNAIDTMEDALRAGSIADSLRRDFRAQVEDLRRALGTEEDEASAAAIVSALDRVAAAVASASDAKDVDEDVVDALEELVADMGFEEDDPTAYGSSPSVPKPRDRDWISPTSVTPGDSVSIHGSGLQDVEIEVDGSAAAVKFQDHDVVVFVAPGGGKGEVVVSGGGIDRPWTAKLNYTPIAKEAK